MRIPPLVVTGLIITSLQTYATKPEIPVVELGKSMEAPDGFRVALETETFPAFQKPPGVPQIAFIAEVPRDVAKTRLSIIWLEIYGDRGELVLDTTLDKRFRGKSVRCSVDVAEGLADRCVLHLEYAPTNEPNRRVKDYVLRLKDHLPKK